MFESVYYIEYHAKYNDWKKCIYSGGHGSMAVLGFQSIFYSLQTPHRLGMSLARQHWLKVLLVAPFTLTTQSLLTPMKTTAGYGRNVVFGQSFMEPHNITLRSFSSRWACGTPAKSSLPLQQLTVQSHKGAALVSTNRCAFFTGKQILTYYLTKITTEKTGWFE